jgi:predicted SnoaL-like aldol condensation-catalyzing enzyme
MSLKTRSLAQGIVLMMSLMFLASVHAQTAQSNKEIAVAYFRMMFEDKDVEGAMKKYVGTPFIQHDPYIADGSNPVSDYYVPYFEQHPQSSADIKHVIAEGDMVVIHSLWKDSPEDRGQAVVDIYRLQDGKIVEHWDVNQDVPDDAANANSMF